MNVSQYKFFKKLTEFSCIDEIWLYGSRARGNHKERSDIDLALVCPHATKNDWSKIMDVIDNADTLLKIDCVRFDALDNKDPLHQSIIEDKKILYQRIS
jgi:predicted nucleotidyltransferase